MSIKAFKKKILSNLLRYRYPDIKRLSSKDYKAVRDVADSGIFDYAYYIRQTEDELSSAPEEPTLQRKLFYIANYLQEGWLKNLNPHPLFDTYWYLNRYPDVQASGMNPLLHYLQYGWCEQRAPHPLFSGKGYSKKYADIGRAEVDPLSHYLKYGAAEGRQTFSIDNLFDSDYYIKTNGITLKNNETPILHYIKTAKTKNYRVNELFDTSWYEKQRQESHGFNHLDALSHYIAVGHDLDLNPHVLFDSDHFKKKNSKYKNTHFTPLGYFLSKSSKNMCSPHTMFDQEYYLSQKEEQLSTPPLIHYLRNGVFETTKPSILFDNAWYRYAYTYDPHNKQTPLEHYMKEGYLEGNLPCSDFNPLYNESVKNRSPLEALYSDQVPSFKIKNTRRIAAKSLLEEFDTEKSEQFISHLQRQELLYPLTVSPLISVIMPTHNRLHTIHRAIKSIQSQTWQNWECIITDDGSDDGTYESIQQSYANDPRISIKRTEPFGVSHARNVAMRVAKGEYFAYLDSDNYWTPDHLKTLLSLSHQQQLDFCYSAIAMEEKEGNGHYRYHEYDADDLLLRNYIDLNSIIHRRCLYDELGGFDEQLARTVDWDLIIRYVRNKKVGSAPIVSVVYDNTDTGDRITVKELSSWRLQVMNKHLIDWQNESSRLLTPQTETCCVSIVIPVLKHSKRVRECVREIRRSTPSGHYEIILVDQGNSAETSKMLHLIAAQYDDITHYHHQGAETLQLALNLGSTQSNTSVLVLLQPDIEVREGWLEPLVEALKDSKTDIVQPLIISPDQRIQNIGMVIGDKSPIPYPLFKGQKINSIELCKKNEIPMLALSGNCVAIKRDRFVKLKGLEPVYTTETAKIDLCLRLENDYCKVIPSSLVMTSQNTQLANPQSQHNDRELLLKRHYSKLQVDDYKFYDANSIEVFGWISDTTPSPFTSFEPQLSIKEDTPADYAVSENSVYRTIAIKVPCPNERVKMEWGDYHFAKSLGSALSRIGYRVHLDFRMDWGNEADKRKVEPREINLVLRGRGAYPLPKNNLNLMWMISHPTMSEDSELEKYDHVFVASNVYADTLIKRVDTPITTLLQCTDPSIFYPSSPEENFSNNLLFVGNSRNQYREIIKRALDEDLDPNIYGTLWEHLIPNRYIHGQNIDNQQLGHYYRSASVVLNDHWPDMRSMGFISNRIFDVLACGVPLISDEVDGLSTFLRKGISFYSDKNSLKELVSQLYNEDKQKQALRNEIANHIISEHSFDSRARTIHETIRELIHEI